MWVLYAVMMKILLLSMLAVFALAGIGWWTMHSASLSDISDNTQKEDGARTMNNEPAGSSDTILDLSGKGLTEVSATVFAQTSITGLDLSHNKLTGALQAEVRHLKNLKTLDLSNNQFTGVPAEVGQLQLLEILDLSNNQLTGLPNELGNLTNLKQLNLSGNEYSEVDLAAIRKKLPATTIVTVD